MLLFNAIISGMASMDMTKGSIIRELVAYAVPLVLGSLFQLAYNAVDSMIAGRFIGTDALAATGMAGPVMNILILGISGLSIGAGVIMSSCFGAKDYEMLGRELSTLLGAGLVFSIAAAVLGILFAIPLLSLLNVPQEVLGMTALYLRIIFLGLPFTCFYNALSQAMKSVGDSKTPLKFLAASSVLNCVLDLFFIGYLGFGITCSAVTTVVAQAASALLCFWYIKARIPLLSFHGLSIDRSLLKSTLEYGSVTALQQACQPVGKLLIQGAVNTLGVAVVAAYNAVTRIDDFAFTPEQSISHGITTFAAQNRGAGDMRRVKEGFRKGLMLEALYFVLIATAVLLLSRPLMSLFVEGEEAALVINEGHKYLSTMAFFYIFPAFTNGIQGFFRGMGDMKVTLISTFIQTSFRVIFTFILVPLYGIHGIAYACAIGWSLMLLFEVPYYFHSKKKLGLDDV